jgi:hypothetical protein
MSGTHYAGRLEARPEPGRGQVVVTVAPAVWPTGETARPCLWR